MPLWVLFSLVFCEQHYEKIRITMYYITEILCSLQVSLGGFRLHLTLCGSFQVVSCSLQVVSSRFLARCRSFQVVSCSLQVVSGRFRSFLARRRLFHVVSGRFLLVVGRFRSFLASCRSFQVVSGRFRSFRVLVSTPAQSKPTISNVKACSVLSLFKSPGLGFG